MGLIIPKFLMGKPTDVFATKMKFLPIYLRNFLAGLIAAITNGSNNVYGLQKPSHKLELLIQLLIVSYYTK